MIKSLSHSVSRRPQFILRFIARYVVAGVFVLYLFKYLLNAPALTDDPISPFPTTPESESVAKITVPLAPTDGHPIDRLVRLADQRFNSLLSTQTSTLSDASAAYRERRGRHPPPGFDEWHAFATKHNAVIVEEFFDQIYRDLEPFWGIPAATIRKDANDYEMRISIRNHTASSGSGWFWTQIWLNMTSTIQHMLPDMDIALNAMDEPRIVVPSETIDEYMAKAAETKKMVPAADAMSSYGPLPPPRTGDNPPMTWETEGSYWDIARRGCPTNSLSRHNLNPIVPYQPVKISMHLSKPHMENGYVSNYTLSTDFCHQPDLQSLEGIFLRPLSISSTKTLLPLFGGSKLSVNNEILLPAPMYWNEEERFMGGGGANIPWEDKLNMVSWRGVATGGQAQKTNWHGFQRHRFVSMNNATPVAAAEYGDRQINFVLPDTEYQLQASTPSSVTGEVKGLSKWVAQWSDVGFVDLPCFPAEEEGQCSYLDSYYTKLPGKSLAEQFKYKYMPDVDGNSFSGRYLGFLRSTSLPIKATLWREWHDDRLVAWKHFVPMDNRFGDYYAIMEYFLGAGNKPSHDDVAKKIALDGQDWAKRVLRKEDMQIYVSRLLLEYARVSSDDRERLGYVADLS
ncbi:Beta-1 2-xylosyltransferase 1 [Ceratocystis platani]|uniref:Beta-1 2-xylosyltransferase 1 n=1 Tax=Ceratocystis fimbriata f. sp. platani TaxID=88771 RepID=A0A0F8B3J9_CERFI|nr:Beta-1 2-xylosyltransferase 1 [Ceratocystis platani]